MSPTSASPERVDGDGYDIRTLALSFRAGAAIGEHSHSWGQLVFAASGVMRVVTRDAAWLTPPTRAIWLPAGLEHRIDMQSAVAMRTLYIAATRAVPLPEAPMVIAVAPLLRELILYILGIGMLTPADPSHERLAGLLIELLLNAETEDLTLPLPRDTRALKLAQHWQANPDDERGISELAADCGATLRTLQRLFPRETGLTIEAWRQRARLLHAIVSLSSGASVTHAALTCGYRSLAAFNTAFQRHFNTTPKKYGVRSIISTRAQL
ncbi:helix-turn-helix domain-containing protein [Duganella sp. FT80W]|uniref:Helix-turn-helix domain-containing protein n=1 Tax=Duganella guangzhouensis TaxID=2666084 RepID=A0A6I2L266_9BURK|nr:helix-turn-helix transcriptional regulator [Duganella guangzhouensis]MRW92171.1 helix-turn-helix domain-containing protein [Duganella guangzhouensis]